MPDTPGWIRPNQLAKEIESLRNKLSLLETLAKEYGIEVTPTEAPAEAEEAPKAPVRRRRRRRRRGTIRSAIADILGKAEEPLHATEILARLKQRRVRVGGKDPLASVSRTLYSTDAFENVGRNTWKLK